MPFAWAPVVLLSASPAVTAVAPLPAETHRANEGIVVTASRTGDPLAGSLTQVTRDDIERRQAVSLLEVLDAVPGVRAFSTGGAGGRSFLSIRGGEPNFTLVLVDGLKLNDPTNSRGGGFDFFAIDPALVERIEVTRGPVSAVHGSDALSGAVNIRLRAPSPGSRQLTARVEGGTRGDAGAGAALEAGWSGGDILGAASWYDSAHLTAGSDLERRQALGQLRQRVGAFEARILGLYGHADRSAFPEDSGGPRLAVNRTRETGEAELTATGFTFRRTDAAPVRPELSLSWSRQEDRSATPGIAPGALSGTPALTADTRFSRFEAIAGVAFEKGPLAATVGTALLRESGRSDGSIDFGFRLPVSFDLVRTTRSAFAEASLRSGGWGLNVAGRYDDVAHGAQRWTGRAAISWQPAPGGPTLFARAAEGYKLPSFYALAHPLIGNPALRPERSRNVEAGVEMALAADGLLRLSLFRNRFRDLIDFDPATFKTVNRDRVRARGVELEASWRPVAAVSLTGGLSWLDLESPTPLRGRPRWQGSLGAAWQARENLEVNGFVRFNSSWFDSSIPTGLVRTQGHAEVDLGVRWRFSPRLSLAAALRNLTGERHEDAVGFPAPGRQLRATLAAAF